MDRFDKDMEKLTWLDFSDAFDRALKQAYADGYAAGVRDAYHTVKEETIKAAESHYLLEVGNMRSNMIKYKE